MSISEPNAPKVLDRLHPEVVEGRNVALLLQLRDDNAAGQFFESRLSGAVIPVVEQREHLIRIIPLGLVELETGSSNSDGLESYFGSFIFIRLQPLAGNSC